MKPLYAMTTFIGLAVVAAVVPAIAYLKAHPARILSEDIAAPPQGILLVLGFDRSGSYRPYLGGAVAGGSDLSSQLDPDQDRLVCYALDTQATELYDNPPLESTEELETILTEKLRHMPPARGTYPAAFWTTVAARVQDIRVPCAIALYSDGDNDETAASEANMRSAAELLAHNKNVLFVAVLGVDPDNRASLNASFACLGRDRFHLYGPQEADTDTLRTCIEQARNHTKGTR